MISAIRLAAAVASSLFVFCGAGALARGAGAAGHGGVAHIASNSRQGSAAVRPGYPNSFAFARAPGYRPVSGREGILRARLADVEGRGRGRRVWRRGYGVGVAGGGPGAVASNGYDDACGGQGAGGPGVYDLSAKPQGRLPIVIYGSAPPCEPADLESSGPGVYSLE